MNNINKTKCYVRTIVRNLDYLWNGIKNILPDEKLENKISRSIVPYRKVLYWIMFVLRTWCQWKMLPRKCGLCYTWHRRFQEYIQLGTFVKLWTRLLEIYDDERGLKWKWQSLVSISIKYSLGRRIHVKIVPIDTT